MADLSVIKLPNNESYNLKDAQAREMIDGKLLPAGGTEGMVLAKSSNSDYDVEWIDIDRTPVSISVTTPPTKTTYEQTESFDPTGMVVTLVFSDGKTRNLPNNTLTFSPSVFSTTGVQNVTISATQSGFTMTTTQSVTVTQLVINTWAKFKKAVDAGIAETLAPVGTQLSDTWKPNSSTTYNTPWDVVHYYPNGDVALKWHYLLPNYFSLDGFDGHEALYYAPSGGLPAGRYYITIGASSYDRATTGHYINFETNGMDAGDQLVIWNYGTNTSLSLCPYEIYAFGSTTKKEAGTCTDSNTGTSLGSTSTTDQDFTNGNINSLSRVLEGYGRYAQSGKRQWLNSNGAAGAWWTPQNPWDRPQYSYNSVRGFLAGLSSDLLDVLENSPVITALDSKSAQQEGYSSDTTMDKIFIPSGDELYIESGAVAAEGANWDYYVSLAQGSGVSGKFQNIAVYPVLKAYSVTNISSESNYQLRTPSRNTSKAYGLVLSNGMVYFEWDSGALNAIFPCTIIHKATT